MLNSDVSQDFLERIDQSKQAMISAMISEEAFTAPNLASFTIGDLTQDDTRTWTYSANV